MYTNLIIKKKLKLIFVTRDSPYYSFVFALSFKNLTINLKEKKDTALTIHNIFFSFQILYKLTASFCRTESYLTTDLFAIPFAQSSN